MINNERKRESTQSKLIKKKIELERKKLREKEELREWVESFKIDEYFDEENEISIIIEMGFESFKKWAFKKIIEKKGK